MNNVYIQKYCKLSKKSEYIAAFPDINIVEDYEENYNDIYGVNFLYYPAPYPNHKGTDWLFSIGTLLYGINGFTVNKVINNPNGLGKGLEIGNEYISFTLGHLSEILVSEGQEINENMAIAKTGNTGFSQGPHLHVQTWLASKNSWVDSTPYMSQTKEIPGETKKYSGVLLPKKSLALCNGELTTVVECGIDDIAKKYVARLMYRYKDTNHIKPTENLIPVSFYPLGTLCINVTDNRKCYLIEYGADNLATVARIRYLDGKEVVVYSHMLYQIPIFQKGKEVFLDNGDKKRIEDHSFSKNGELVYRVSDVIFADRISNIK